MFGGHSNWEHISILKQALNIPLIGSGDIDSPETAFEMLNTTGCDALMIGRCALGKPWLFRQITDFFNRGDYSPITKNEIHKVAISHLEYALRFKEEYIVVREMRSQLCHYIKAMPGSKELRDKINHTETATMLKQHLDDFFLRVTI